MLPVTNLSVDVALGADRTVLRRAADGGTPILLTWKLIRLIVTSLFLLRYSVST